MYFPFLEYISHLPVKGSEKIFANRDIPNKIFLKYISSPRFNIQSVLPN